MRYFPSYFDLRDRPVLIVGGGAAAMRKGRLLFRAGAVLTFIAPQFDRALEAEFGSSATLRQATFAKSHLKPRPALAVVATENPDLDEKISADIRRAHVPVNVVDRPELSDFVVPSLVERGDLVIGISTGGKAPVLGRSIRGQLEALLPAALGRLTDFAGDLRQTVAARLPQPVRRAFWEQFFTGATAALVLAGREQEARQQVLRDLNSDRPNSAGFVSIVGAGPGDPDLLTLKALRVLQNADIVLYDNLVSEGIVYLARRDADRIYVGKKKADHVLAQEDISSLMIRLAGEGKNVVRLKGGDPFIFGRGGEEIDALRKAGIAVEVVPGITAATGCGAAASIPLTHRDHAQAVTFVTGHARGDTAPNLDWRSLVGLGHTLVVYMGVSTAAQISANLVRAGMTVTMPVAIVEKGTTPEQKIIRTTISQLPDAIYLAGVAGPAVLVIGAVAAKADGVGLVDLVGAERLRA